ncbi:MAG: hypothetical protein Q8Q67_00730 [bacterium]|nr:hypothetical protein [bacterium]
MKNVVIIIDSLSIRQCIGEQLKWKGFNVLFFQHEQEILENIEQIDFLIIDPFVPLSLLNHPKPTINRGYESGIHLIKILQKISSSLKVLVYSSLSAQDLIEAGLSESIARQSIRMPEKFEDILEKFTAIR